MQIAGACIKCFSDAPPFFQVFRINLVHVKSAPIFILRWVKPTPQGFHAPQHVHDNHRPQTLQKQFHLSYQ